MTGFLLAGIGNVDPVSRKKNFFVVDKKRTYQHGDFLLAGLRLRWGG